MPDDPAARRELARLALERWGPAALGDALVLGRGARARADLGEGPADGTADETDRRWRTPSSGSTCRRHDAVRAGRPRRQPLRHRARSAAPRASPTRAVTRWSASSDPARPSASWPCSRVTPRHGTVVAVRDAVVYRLGRDEFERTARSHPDVTHTMLATLARRLNHRPARGGTHAPPQHVAVVPVGVTVPVASSPRRWAGRWTARSPPPLVTSASIDAAVGAGAVDADPASPLGVRVQRPPRRARGALTPTSSSSPTRRPRRGA